MPFVSKAGKSLSQRDQMAKIGKTSDFVSSHRYSADLESLLSGSEALLHQYQASSEPVNERWSVTLCQFSHQSNEEHCGELMPQISAHKYDRAYYGSTPSQDSLSLRSRFSTPLSRAQSPESDEPCVERFSTAPFPTLDSPYLSLHVSPTPDSPLNSSMDYKPSFSDIPAIFHRGAGKRGGVRFAPDALQSLSLFAAAPAALRSSLAATRAPAGRRCAGWGGSRGLLEVLLAMSQKHDLSGLTAVRVCNHVELNPFAERDAQLCYDFLNTGQCRRPAGMCRFRHVCSDHIEAVVDRIRSGKMPVSLIFREGDS